MKAKGWGRIISLGSHCAKEPHLDVPLIGGNVVRSGLVALHKTLSWELGPLGITVNTIPPEFIDTPMLRVFVARPDQKATAGMDPEELVRKRAAGSVPLGRTGRPEEAPKPSIRASVPSRLCSRAFTSRSRV